MCGVFRIGGKRSKNICTYICGTVGTISVATRKIIAEGGKVRED